MKKSAKILVIAALVVSAVVMTSCSNLMTLIAGKPEGTYVYAWNDAADDNGSLMFTFDGNNFVYTVNANLLGYTQNSSWEGTIKLNGAKATIKKSDNKAQEGMELVSTDRWYSFTAVDGDIELGPFKKQ